MPAATTDNRIREIEEGFALLGISSGHSACCSYQSPSFEICTGMKTVRTVARSNSTPHEILDAKLEQGS